MNSNFYLPRKLSSHDKIYTEAELIAASKYVVVLAEPGGGKTELMKSLAAQMNTQVVTASKFGYVGAKEKNISLVIDAFDELAKIDAAGIYKLLSEAEKSEPTYFYISSRSSEWDNSATKAFEEFIGHPPLIIKPCEFSKAEQRDIFQHHVRDENFDEFQKEAARFGLEMLLPNPQFLKLFADAYIESGRGFTDKRSIFSKAVERLAKEANSKLPRLNQALSNNQKIDLSSEVFAKILLSGAEGVGVNEAYDDRMYPLLVSLVSGNSKIEGILATRLFKPGDSVGQHRPVHKIVAEYCAANYLVNRIMDPADHITLQKCLSIIAPNSIIREELRGLLGWMASLGNKSVQEKAIELDAYAVLSNGDPSQLERSSKRLLVNQLKEVATKDPYFRRADFWRRFSVGGFFTLDVMDDIKSTLLTETDGHLRGLFLELLMGSSVIALIKNELHQLVTSPSEDEHIRGLASKCLLNVIDYDHFEDLELLLCEASEASLNIAAKIIEHLSPESVGQKYIANFLQLCANLYPGHRQRYERKVGARYFVKLFISCLDIRMIESLLDDLTKNLACGCGKKCYECDCRNGISKIVGLLLDRYFELATAPFDPKRVWQWVENLNFHDNQIGSLSKAVQVLQENDELRQGIIAHVFTKLTDREEIFQTRIKKFDRHCHSGLHFQAKDFKYVVDLAFEIGSTGLWSSFMAHHQFYRSKEERGPNSLRRHMRSQAQLSPALLREWAKSNRSMAKAMREQQIQLSAHTRMIRRHRKQQNKIQRKNIQYIQDNRVIVEGGRHWNCLVRFAELVLINPERIANDIGDEKIVRTALLSCIDFIAPTVPDLPKLAELHCKSKGSQHIMILFAACLEIMRVKGNLDSVDIKLLKALRTDIHMGYGAVSQDERDALKSEIDRLIFINSEIAEDFLRQYIEPQLCHPCCSHPEIWWLAGEEVFSHLRATISIEWLRRFNELGLETLDSLFEIAAQFGDRDDLKEIITLRCSEFISNWPNPTNVEKIENERMFWFIRAWYFLKDTPHFCWEWIKVDKNIVVAFYERSQQRNYGENSYWPRLTAAKVEAILVTFFDQWPKMELPSGWGTDSPDGEKAYRFLTEVGWTINSDDPDNAIPVLHRLLNQPHLEELYGELRSILAHQVKQKALRDFEPPTPNEVVDLLDHDAVVTVEGLRQLITDELQDFQSAIAGGEFNSGDRFYENKKHLDERRCTEIIAERLSLRLRHRNIIVTPEHQLKDLNRSDFTVTKVINGKRRLLVTEVKGQWHKELYSAASVQLNDRYSIHPDAEQQGIYLVIWFGVNEKVAGLKNPGVKDAKELKNSIEATLPSELKGLIDIFVLDVSKQK